MSFSDAFSLHGQTALVTGARRGIGFAMARALAEAGADIIAASASQETSDSDIEKNITALGRRFAGYRCDFADRHAVDGFIDTVLHDHPTIDILVNNAGTIRRQPSAEHSDENWDAVLEANLHAPFALTRAVGGRMVACGHGKIIFTASLLTFQGGINVPGYAAAKGGIGQLVKAFANEWASKGVNVNAIAPGYIATDNTAALRADEGRSRQILERIPAGRWGTPDDLAGATVFLASRASDYVHGTILPVDGGWLGR